ncbi:hypothetical protein HELRODRAFT_82476, partial [Helobdella robusta]|uniref:Glucosidase 2 subunit beta n=1 Tax=Helobdella robusta TaxID=6412 RepID=T1G4S7_HELRO
FTCLDKSGQIPFNQVNDDYCDCPDGSDEPGTSACQNGIFYCPNSGYRPSIVPSSRVNDGVCDCCDGSDEYSGIIICQNNCLEKERKICARLLDLLKLYTLTNTHTHKRTLTHKHTNTQAKIEELQVEKSRLEEEQKDLEAKKKELEIPEEEAKNRFKLAWEEGKAQRRSERKMEDAMKTFQAIDADSDGKVSIEEMRGRKEFDIDLNGEVSHEEAKEYMEDHDYMEFAGFYEKIWNNIEQLFKTSQPSQSSSPPEDMFGDDNNNNNNDGDDDEDDDEEEDDIDADRDGSDDDTKDQRKVEKPTVEKPASSGFDEDNEEMPPYDEETQKMIDAAEHARSEVSQLETKLRDLEKEIEHAQKILDSDYGPRNEFYPLAGQCFELTDREYVYKLCPFDRTTQRNKHGGSETTLGLVGWLVRGAARYSTMFFDRGQNCWNGPDRSTKVLIECGVTNDLTSASEPNRCEYQFTFNTPAACNEIPARNEQNGGTTPRVEL